jgi:hypothetical protein
MVNGSINGDGDHWGSSPLGYVLGHCSNRAPHRHGPHDCLDSHNNATYVETIRTFKDSAPDET